MNIFLFFFFILFSVLVRHFRISVHFVVKMPFYYVHSSSSPIVAFDSFIFERTKRFVFILPFDYMYAFTVHRHLFSSQTIAEMVGLIYRITLKFLPAACWRVSLSLLSFVNDYNCQRNVNQNLNMNKIGNNYDRAFDFLFSQTDNFFMYSTVEATFSPICSKLLIIFIADKNCERSQRKKKCRKINAV